VTLNRRWPTRLALVALVISPGLLRASSPAAELPNLALRTLEDKEAGEAAYLRSGKWLLAYVGARSGPSASLLQTLQQMKAGTALVVVVNGKAEEARQLASQFAGRLEATWLVDPDAAVPRSLGLQAIPVVLGLDGKAIRWRLTGALPDRTTLRSIVGSWQ
jgi:hypothetical protein